MGAVADLRMKFTVISAIMGNVGVITQILNAKIVFHPVACWAGYAAMRVQAVALAKRESPMTVIYVARGNAFRIKI